MNEGLFYSLDGPLDSMPVDLQVRAGNLAGFGGMVRNLGADPRRFYEDHGIDPGIVRDPDAYIDGKSLVELLEHCSSSFNDSLFGLKLARCQEPDVFGAVAALARSAPTVREGIKSFIDFIPIVHCPATTLELVEGPQTAEVRWHLQASLGMGDQAKYKGTLTVLKLLRQLGGRSFRPNHVHLGVDARHKDIAEIADTFGCGFRGHAPLDVIAFPVSVLDQPVASANRLVFRLISGYLDRVRATSRVSVVDRVEDYVRGSLSSGNCSIEHCAKKLGSSVRTLQATLSEQGLRFSDILERQRMELGKTYLERGEMSLDDVAAMLGYAEQSSFGRAFKRWTGATPQGYRRRLEARQAH